LPLPAVVKPVTRVCIFKGSVDDTFNLENQEDSSCNHSFMQYKKLV
jgi:hypothetical protein